MQVEKSLRGRDSGSRRQLTWFMRAVRLVELRVEFEGTRGRRLGGRDEGEAKRGARRKMTAIKEGSILGTKERCS